MIRKQSPKRAKENREYLKLNKLFLAEHTICEVEGCMQDATEVHHKRGRIGKDLTDTKYFLAVCRSCHQKIEDNPVWAKENNYSVSRLNKAA